MLHAFLERHVVIVFGLFGSDVAAGSEHVAVALDLFAAGALAETGDVGVLARVLSDRRPQILFKAQVRTVPIPVCTFLRHAARFFASVGVSPVWGNP